MKEVTKPDTGDTHSSEFEQEIQRRMDGLIERMNLPGAVEATGQALFTDPASLNRSYDADNAD